jgi:hypothetical protein
LIVIFTTLPALAQISPGKLSAAHQALEGIANCTQCHQIRAEVSKEKCLTCHQVLVARIAQGRGYHASKEVADGSCSSCHREHNGREYDLIYWPQGIKGFNHASTGYALEGAHQGKECRSCHKPDLISASAFVGDKTVRSEKTFLGLNRDCLACHTDEHQEQLTDRCLDCHTETAWSPAAKYNHNNAKYKLTGKHSPVECLKCHPWIKSNTKSKAGLLEKKQRLGSFAKYQGLAFAGCADCHKDVHGGRLGADCGKCHTTEGFKTGGSALGFDHSRTAYPLQGKHLQVECKRCHVSGDMTRSLAHGRCCDCHREDHGSVFAARPDSGKCEACHTVEGYSPSRYTLEDHQRSRYPLTGSHLAVPCNRCHVPIQGSHGQQIANFDLQYRDCADCHKDVHQGQVNLWTERGGCAFCHTTETWHRITFDHSKAQFQLEGKHREILCLKCHYIQSSGEGKQVWMKPLARECSGCHKDVHQGQFLQKGESAILCEKCHQAGGWTDLKFTHNRDSRFVLDGAHEKVPCRSCHKPVAIQGQLTNRYRPLDSRCADCHQQIPKAGNK